MITALIEFYLLMDCDHWRSDLAGAAARKCCLLYASLGKEARDRGNDLLWRVKPTFHLFVEVAEHQSLELGNPKLYWTYKDEDFMGWLGKVAASRGGPKQGATTVRRVLDRWRCLSHLKT